MREETFARRRERGGGRGRERKRERARERESERERERERERDLIQTFGTSQIDEMECSVNFLQHTHTHTYEMWDRKRER